MLSPGFIFAPGLDQNDHIDYYLYVLSQTQKTTTEGCTTCFNALGVGSRMSIYKLLRQRGKAPVAAIVEHVGLTQPTVSYHLNEMKNAGILESERDGKEIYYKISDTCKVFHQDCVLKEVKFPA
jgi:predicted transcriptional regulator